MPRYKYLINESKFKNDAHLALNDRLRSIKEFEAFYSALGTDNQKNEFLRASVAYLYFVKNGNWHVDVPNTNKCISYFTNSFKLVAILGIIESLSNERFLDFYEWLSKDKSCEFPINEPKDLSPMYDEYKKRYGSIRKCKKFFNNCLPDYIKNELLSSVRTRKKSTEKSTQLNNIEEFAALLYRERSNFAHEIENTGIFDGLYVFCSDKKEELWELPIDTFLKAFEIGLLKHFKPDWKDTTAESDPGTPKRFNLSETP